MSMMGEMTFFLGLQVNQSPRGIFINQSKYVLEILIKYGMETYNPVGTPMKIKYKLDYDKNGTLVDATKYCGMIGALMYLTSSRLNIVHATCLCARYQAMPIEKHLKEVKNADYAGWKDTFKSTFGEAQFYGEKMLTDYGFHFNKIPIYYDSKAAIAISCNPVQHSRTKHIAVRYQFIKEHIEKGTIEMFFVKTDYQLAELFTKSLTVDRFNYLVRRLDSLRQILHLNSLETIIQSSSNIIKHAVAEFVQFINAHQPVLLVFILIDESSWIGVSSVSFLAFEIGSVRIWLYIESKAFFDSEISQLSLNQKKQHVFNVLNAKPLEIAFLEFIELVIISTHSYPIQMLVVMPFDDLKFDDSDDYTFGVDISSRLPVDRKSIEMLTFAPPMRDSPESIFVIANRCLTPHCARYQVFNPLYVPIICCLCLCNRSCILSTGGTTT
uniref:Reverse transcriptase Ty1/copia-type domain-containing protein n=1 Tax=Tanacetum cinerariifolium TaxID=118510 RepID=A0A6L2KFE4_TANCI|nr:hypothetical protein [Tanacetum cinerariifolium]